MVVRSARTIIAGSGEVLSPEAGLGVLIAKRHDRSLRPPTALLGNSDISRTLRQSPALAGLGYVLDEVTPELRESWAEALNMLQGRAAFPGDGQYFANDPTELLGVLSGIRQLEPNGGPQTNWLTALLQEGLGSKAIKAPIAVFAAVIALEQLGTADTSFEALYSASDLIREDALLLSTAIGFAFPSSSILPMPDVEEAFAKLVLEGGLRINSPADAVAAALLCKRMSDRILLGMRDDVSIVERVVSICRRFPHFLKPLQSRHANRPAFMIGDEYDVQDALHGILKLHFDDVRPEEVGPSVAGGSSRVDFYLKRERLIIEVKYMGSSMTQKKLRGQLIEDIAVYAAMADVDTLVCLVYDPDQKCENPAAIETDLQNTSGSLTVRIVICPHGH